MRGARGIVPEVLGLPPGFPENRNVGGVDTAIMPRKHEIPVGTLRSILSQAHISLSGERPLRRSALHRRHAETIASDC